MLEPHGGELGGFILVRGDAATLAQVRASETFQRLILRAGFVVQNIGVVSARLDSEAGRFIATANDITSDLR